MAQTLQTANVEELRAKLVGMWDSVAGGWGEHAEFVEARGAEITEALLRGARVGRGDRVLELACGAGGAGIAAAERVGAAGEVVLSDVAPRMTAMAASRARERGLANVSARVLDIEDIDEPDASYDVVLCREGLMLVPDPGRAAAEIRRVLRPGGRLALAVWGPRARNPWLTAVFDAVTAQTGAPVPAPGVPGPFSLDDAAVVARALADAGLADVEVVEQPTPYRAASVEEWWTRTVALAGPLAQRLASLPAPAAQALASRAAEAIRPYTTPSGGLDIPGVALIATATRR